jgi:hypothetical protein
VARRVARLADGGELRRFLLDEERHLLDLAVGVGTPVYEAAVDALAAGGEWRLQRWHLPFDHPARAAGGLYDQLVLGADDVLRPRPA